MERAVPRLEWFPSSLSVGSTSTKYLWTSGSSSPYTINISANYFTKPAESNPYRVEYYRSIAVVDTATGAWFDVRVQGMTLKTNFHTTENIAFANVASSLEMTPAHAFDGLSSQTILVRIRDLRLALFTFPENSG